MLYTTARRNITNVPFWNTASNAPAGPPVPFRHTSRNIRAALHVCIIVRTRSTKMTTV